ncbi:MAG TPA: aldose epimerase family protein [Caulobacterales bacterium]|nr:aldose epimerase family protein [Caulobacterales bacterium]
MKLFHGLCAGALLLATVACSPAATTSAAASHIEEAAFGQTSEGQQVKLFTLTNEHGMEVKLMSYGAAITSIKTPDRTGAIGQVVLGFDTLDPYLAGVPFFGAVVGRYGNRIARGHFTLDGHTYTLATNNAPNHLHGGDRGFDKRVWDARPFEDDKGPGVEFTYVSADGEEGYPGELTAHVTYQLGADDTLTISYEATTTKATPVNLTNHAYFNLSGDVQRDILGEQLKINADRFTPVDSTLIPTGELKPVEGTPFDFRAPTAIGARIDAHNQQITYGHGYDHNWVLNQTAPGQMTEAAELYDAQSGRVMTIRTTEPGIQFYSGNFLDGSLNGRGVAFARRIALCLETQHFPDSPNHPSFPSTILQPGDTYRSQTVLTFATRPQDQ